jgi:hypothetical protein
MKYRHAKRVGIYRSAVEKAVGESLIEMGLPHSYESTKLAYVSHHNYVPDFTIGGSHIEVKGWWPPADRAKLLKVIRSHPTVRILMAFENPHLTLNRKSKTTYSEWCAKRGIAWCGLPIPPDFLRQWLHDPQRTFPVPVAIAATEQRSIQTVLSFVSCAEGDTTVKATPGKG